MQRASFKRIFREKEFWLLVLLGILYFHRPLFLGETFFFRELHSDLIPQKHLFAEYIKHGQLPLWDPYMHGGMPYLSNIGHTPFYPSNLLYLFLPFFEAFNLNIVLHILLSCVSAYLFSRIIGLQPLSSFVVGSIYGFCGYNLSFTNLVSAFMAIPHLPLSMMFWHLYLSEGKKRWFVLTIVVGVMRTLSGAPELNIIGMLFLLGWALLYPYPSKPFFRKIFLWILLGIFILGIASIQIFPMLEMVLQSSRGQRMDYVTFSGWSLFPRRLPEFVFPNFLGYLDTLLPQIYYWGRKVASENRTPYIINIYFGFVTLVLAIFGGLHKGENHALSRRMRKALLLLIVMFSPLSLGRFSLFFESVYRYVPLIAFFRYPIKFLSIGIFPIALLAGYTSEVHFGEMNDKRPDLKPSLSKSFPSWKMLIVLWGIAAIVMIFTGMFLLSSGFAVWFQEVYFKQPGGEEIIYYGLRRSFVHAFVIWLLFTLLYHYRRLKKRSWQHWFLACILIADLLVAGKRVNPTAPKEIFTDLPPIVQIVRREIGNGRIFRSPNPPVYTLQAPSNEAFWAYRWGLEVLESYRATFYRLPIIFHEGLSLRSLRLQKLLSVIYSLSWEQRLPLLSTGGVTLILTSDDISAPGVHRIAEIPNRSNIPFYLYRNETAAARVEFITNWKHVASDDEALKAMLRPGYDPRYHAVLQEPESTLFDWHVKTPKSQEAASNFSGCNDPAQINKIASNTVSTVFLVSNNCDGYLVFSEPFYPGWRVYVDGKLTSILRANYAFSAIFLKAGEHKVERHYRPNSLFIGALSSIVFCVLLGVITYKGLLNC